MEEMFSVCSFILEDFQKYGVDVSLVSEHAQCNAPASVVISNISTGSRTILHMNRCGKLCVCVCVCVCVSLTSSVSVTSSSSPLSSSQTSAGPFRSVKGRRSLSVAFILAGAVTLPVCLSPSFIMADFSRRAVDVSAVVWQLAGQTPCACCVVCPPTGSRTVFLYDT